MKKSFAFYGILLTVFFLSFAACKKGKELRTDSGFKYVLYTDSKGKKAQIGDYVTIELVYRTSKDSVLFDSRKNASPLRFKLEKIPFQGSYEEGLILLAEGDSATFYVPADSLYEYYFRNDEIKPEQSATVFKPHSVLLFDVKLLDVQSYVEAEQERMIEIGKQEKNEKELIRRFLWGKDFLSSKDSGIYFYRKLKNGGGTPIDSGKFVTVRHSGKFLDGRIFENSDEVKPFTFRTGSNQVVKGLEYALYGMREGDRFEILIPSKYAYGEEGLLNSSNGTFDIPPFTPLLYELEVIQVTDTLHLVKK